MRVFNVNKGIGYASSGVEYAQKYRKELFEAGPVDDYYIFLNYISTNVSIYTDLMNFERKQVLWIYNVLSGRPAQDSDYPIEKFLNALAAPYKVTFEDDKRLTVQLEHEDVRYELTKINTDKLNIVRQFEKNKLVQILHFDHSLNNFEEYQAGKLARRVFFKLNGEKAFEQFYENGEITVTLIDNQILYGLTGFFTYFMQKLGLKADDAVIIDRSLDAAEILLPDLVGKVRLFSVVHAEHYNENLSTGTHILWNNNYEYVFDNANYFEAIIVSTERQKEVLKAQLAKPTKIVVIPVGYIEKIVESTNYQPFSLITASRLASEKHIDIIIKAVVAAKSKIPELKLDIYGEGGERGKLEQLINELKATDYIKLKGHHKLTSVYKQYGAYVSASTSEGFGLSLLEATAESLPIIGADVDYGNREFIVDGKSGLLYPRGDFSQMVNSLEQALLTFYATNMVETARPIVRRQARKYLKENVAKVWEELMLGKGVATDEG
ncbi:glycosyltransferase family protein [Weissella oryzae SG25]|uniref:Glycosyltransferase family protein n=1 Tax=Weissella oryzae (strain DSM 25784 / JCM 18191 / LMG 30913 / SG25) TaxID=1329250 RepID=A0A069CUV8_WEIOS|nr:glycosyltransferase [Weissella oryzae]GAK31182.1 glycosyltransferase family protein [Weissella oryzae SG25]